MKTGFYSLIATMVLITAAAAQDFVAPMPPPEREPAPTREMAPPAVDGALPNAVRSPNPLQMVNPFAPRAYGSGRQYVEHDERDPFLESHERRPRPIGIRLFTFEF